MTNSFGQNDLVDVGLHGKVYPVVLEGKHVAVKRLYPLEDKDFFAHVCCPTPVLCNTSTFINCDEILHIYVLLLLTTLV